MFGVTVLNKYKEEWRETQSHDHLLYLEEEGKQ